MPKGIPNKKPEQTNGEHISKMEAMRRALAEMGRDCKAAEYQSFIKSKFGIDMTTDMISNYKSTLTKDLPKTSTAPTPHAPPKTARAFNLGELEEVKALADKIGAKKLQQLAQVLAK